MLKNKLVDLGHCLAFELSGGKLCLFDRQDLGLLDGIKWSLYVRRRKHFTPQYQVACGKISMHRLLLGFPKSDIDHKDGNALNNQRSNLRIATKSQNLANRGKQPNNTSGYKGVFHSSKGKPWISKIQVSGKRFSLGSFQDKESAARAYDAAAVKYFGEFARTNF